MVASWSHPWCLRSSLLTAINECSAHFQDLFRTKAVTMELMMRISFLVLAAILLQPSSCVSATKSRQRRFDLLKSVKFSKNTCKVYRVGQSLRHDSFSRPLLTTHFPSFVLTFSGKESIARCGPSLSTVFADSCNTLMPAGNLQIIPGHSSVVGDECIVQLSFRKEDVDASVDPFNEVCLHDTASCLHQSMKLPRCVRCFLPSCMRSLFSCFEGH